MCMHYASLTNNNVNGYAVSQITLTLQFLGQDGIFLG